MLLNMEKDYVGIEKINNGYLVTLELSRGDDYKTERHFASTLEEAYAKATEYFASR